jgi:hypothetical protein
MHMKMTPTLRKRALRKAKTKTPGQVKHLRFILTTCKQLARLLDRQVLLRAWWQPCHQCSSDDLVSLYVQPDGSIQRETMHRGER